MLPMPRQAVAVQLGAAGGRGGGFEVMLVAVLAASKMQADSGWASRGSRRAEPV